MSVSLLVIIEKEKRRTLYIQLPSGPSHFHLTNVSQLSKGIGSMGIIIFTSTETKPHLLSPNPFDPGRGNLWLRECKGQSYKLRESIELVRKGGKGSFKVLGYMN